MPVARKVWQPSLVMIPALTARRTIMRRASWRRHPVAGQLLAAAAAEGAEQGRGLLAADAGGRHIFVDVGLEQVVRRHLVLLAAFLVQPHPPALALRVVVLDVHVERGRDPGEGVDQESDQRAVAQPDDRRHIDAVEQLLALRRRRAPASCLF